MALPKIDLPTYKIELKSINKTVTFRPFLVKEEKLLLMALESDDYITIVDGIKKVINNCMLEEIDIEELPLFEIEHLFLNLRARSMGEKIELTYICQNMVEEKKCGHDMDLVVDLLKVDMDLKTVNPVLKLTQDVGIKLKFPTLETSKSAIYTDEKTDQAIKIIEECTEYLFDAEQTYKVQDMEEGEFVKFIESLTHDQFLMIKNFFEEMPMVTYDGIVKCGKCKKDHKIHLEGIQDFFE